MGKFGRPSHKVKMRTAQRNKKVRARRKREEKHQARLAASGQG